jgi:betaine lipid synthase
MLGLSAFVPRDPFYQLTIALCFVGILVATIFAFALRPKSKKRPVGTLEAYLKFIYGCFLKPHTGDGSGSQQDALVGHLHHHRMKSALTCLTGELLQGPGGRI